MTFTFLPVHQIRHKKLWCQKKTGLKWQKHLKLISMYSVSLHNTKCIVSHFEHFWQHLKNNLKPSEELKGECVRVCFRRRVLNNRLSLTVRDATGWQASHSWPVLHGEVCVCVWRGQARGVLTNRNPGHCDFGIQSRQLKSLGS